VNLTDALPVPLVALSAIQLAAVLADHAHVEALAVNATVACDVPESTLAVLDPRVKLHVGGAAA
jgi:hypothetical protein